MVFRTLEIYFHWIQHYWLIQKKQNKNSLSIKEENNARN
jgi:hypothetical protein